MKNFVTVFLLAITILFIAFTPQANAQSTANYTYATSTSGSLALDKDGNAVDMSTGTTQLYGTSVDTYTGAVQNLGFTFVFMGNFYTQFSANPDGQVRLGSTVISGHTSSATASTPFILVNNIDSKTDATTGKVHFKTQAGTGGQVLIIEWKDILINWNATGTTLSTFQLRLYQSNGAIEMVYGQMWNSSTSAQSENIGFSSSNTAGTIGQLTTINVTPTYNSSSTSYTATSFTASSAMTNLNSASNGSRRVFTFTPPAAATAPTSLSFTSVGITGMTLNWTDNATTETGYAIYRSTDDVNYTYVTTTAANATSSAQTGLTPGTTYYWKVYAVNEGALSSALSGSQATNAGTLSGTKTVGPTGDYATLTAAVTAIQTNGLAGALTLELQTTYVSTGETFPINFTNLTTTNTKTITIVPNSGATNLSISTNNATGTILLDNGSYVTIDGRPGATGTSKQLTIENTVTTGYAVKFINDAVNNTIKYCTVKGVNTSTTNGVIWFSTTTGANGNDNNTIDNCDLRDGSTTPTNIIYSSGTTTTTATNNSSNTISNNNIYNFFAAAAASNGINLTSTGNTDWTISGNSFYQTATRTATSGSTHTGILIGGGNNYLISGNYIGGGAASAGGTAWTQAGSFANRFIGISLAVGTTTATSVQNNTIANFSWSSSSGATSLPGIWIGIYLSAGNANIGTVTGNTIGSGTGTGSVSATSSTTGAISFGIGSGSSSSTVSISNNTIGSITTAGSSTSISHSFVGIQTTAGTTLTISGNTIGSLTTANSINASTASTSTTGQHVAGILNSSSATVSITNNTIANLNNAYNGTGTTTFTPQMRGIANSSGVATITGNTIRDLAMASPYTGTGSSSTLIGLSQTSTTAGQTVSQNTIYNLRSTTATAAIYAAGLYYNGPTSGANVISRNNIHNIAFSTTGTSAVMNGMNIAAGTGTFSNNMIALGRDTSGNSLTTAFNIVGILVANSSAENFFFNSVYIGGTGVGSTATNTYAFNRTASGVDSLYNNIFVNARSNATTGGKHYAIGINNTTTFVSNYNVFNVTGTGGVFGVSASVDQSAITNWRSTTSQDANSAVGNPQFIAPDGSGSAADLHVHASNPTPIEATGSNVGTSASITTDFDGATRSGLTPVDIGADAGNFVGLDLIAPVIGYTTLTNTTSTSNRDFTGVTITDGSSVNTTAGTSPRLYFKKTTNANTYNDNTNGTDGWKYVEANGASSPFDFSIDYSKLSGGAGVAIGDTIQYFVVAQDLATTPNVGINSGTFAATPSSVALTSGAFPLTGTINSYRILGSISGAKTIGASGADYTTLTAAVADLNNKVLTGALTLTLNSDYSSGGETFPITINANPGSSATNTVTIKPASGATVSISGSSTVSIIKLNGADYVTIDGSNTALSLMGSDRSLTITNTSVASGSAVVWLASTGTGAGATHNTVKNANIIGGTSTASTTVIGLYIGGSSISTSTGGADNDSNLVSNCLIVKARYGIYSVGENASNKNQFNQFSGNTIGSTTSTDRIKKMCIVARSENNLIINGNSLGDIYNPSATGDGDVGGIVLGEESMANFTTTTTTPVTNAQVYGNLIHDIADSSTFSATGIEVLSSSTEGANALIYNNMIRGVRSNGTSGDFCASIFTSGGTVASNNRIFYNSILMSGAFGANMSQDHFAIALGNTVSRDTIKNNIFVNTATAASGANAYAIGVANATTSLGASNYNDFYTTGGQGGGLIGMTGGLNTATDQATLSAWQTATGQDANSKSADPLFTSSTNLHINTSVSGSPASNAGTSLASVTTDYDGDNRNGSTPDMGADEFFYPVPQAFTLTSPSGAGQGVSGTLTWAASTNALRYDVYMDQNNPPTTLLAGNVAGTSTGYSNLSPSTTYYWEVYAEGADSANGGYVKSTNGPLSFTTVTPPADPTALVISNVKKDSMYLSWTDNAADGPNQDTGFVVYRKAGSAPSVGTGSPDSVGTASAFAGTGTVNYQDHGLLPNTRYYYRVSARNANGESNFTSADSTTLAETPSAPTASNPLYTSLTVALAAPSPNPATTQFALRVNYASALMPTTKYVHTNGALVDTAVWGTYANFGSAAGVTVTGLTLGTEYTFDVKARNANNIETGFGNTLVTSTASPISSFPYSTDFEGVSDNFWSTATVSGTTNDWVRGTPAKTQIASAHSGTKAWVTKTTGSYSNNWNAAVYSPMFNFTALAQDPSLLFWHNFKTEAGYEGLVVEYTTDGGSTWRRVDSTLGTGGNFTTAKSVNWYNSSSTSGNVVPPKFSGGTTAYTGHASGWIQSTSLLTGLAGKSLVQFRWRFNSETTGVDEGWAVDDIRVAIDVIPPTVTYTALSHTQSTSTRQLTATIKGGVDVRPAGAPRIYYKKNAAGSYYSAVATSIADTSFTFDIDPSNIGTVSTGDTVLYYVAAQDSNGNTASYPAGSSATVDPPNATVTSPSFYIIIGAPLSGDYTVGTALFNSLTGNDISFEKRTRTVKVEVPDFDADARSSANDREASNRRFPVKNTKWIEVDEEYAVPMINGKEYSGDLFTQDKMSPMSGVYATLTAAVSDLNLRGVSGPVRFLLTDGTYSGETLPITIGSVAGASATNTVTIRPNTGVSSTITGSSATAILKLNGADYVIIDGSNSGGTDRSLTIANSNTGTSSAVIWVGSNSTDGATNNTVKNTIVTGNASTTTAIGIFSGSGTTIYGVSTAANSGNTYENNKVSKSQDGIVLGGMSTTTLDQNAIIRNNSLGSSTLNDGTGITGITAVYQNNALITGNDVQNVVGSLSYDMAGIDLEDATSSTVSSNSIHNVKYTGSSTYKVNPIFTANSVFTSSGTPSGNTFVNNMIYDIASSNTSIVYSVSGIALNGGYGDKIYFNSVYLNGSMGATAPSFCFSNGNPLVSTTTSNIEVRDNIFYNKGTATGAAKQYALYTLQTSLTGNTYNHNDYYVLATSPATSVLGYFNGADRADLAAWKSATSQDANSISADPLFTSSTNLHIVNSAENYSPVANIGAALAGVTTDIDGNTRQSTPDLGADEFVSPAPAAFTLMSPTGVSQPVSSVLLWHKATGATRYDVYAGTDNPPMTLVANNLTDTSYTFNGNPSTTYYWDVKAENTDSASGSRTTSTNGPLSYTTVDAPLAPSNLTLETGLNTPGALATRAKISELQQSLATAKSKEEVTAIDQQIAELQNILASEAYITLTWTDNAANEDSFLVYRKLGSAPSVGAPYTDLLTTVSSSAGTGGTKVYVNEPLPLDTRYYYKVTAMGNSGIESGFASADTTTFVQTPDAPTYADVHWSRMNIIVQPVDNPATAQYAIYNTESGKYVSANGAFGSWSPTPVWQTYAQWGGASGIQLTGLTRGTVYSFKAKARNSNLTETALGSQSAQQTSFEFGSSVSYSRNVRRSIPDNLTTGVYDTIAAPAFSGIYKVRVKIDSLTHTYVGDLSMSLRSPSGQTMYLMARPGSGTTGSSGDNFIGTELTDDASRQIESMLSTEAPYTGMWKPDSGSVLTSFIVFNGNQPAGNWILNINDQASTDTGSIHKWSLMIDSKSLPNSISVKKVLDHDGDINTTADQVAKSWHLEVRSDSLGGAVLASGDADSIGTPNEYVDGTYYAIESDSAGYNSLGYFLDGTPHAGSTNNVQLNVAGGDQHPVVTFVNFIPNHFTGRKFKDNDGDFNTAGDRSAKAWRLELYRNAVSGGNLVAASDSGTLTLDNLGDGTFIAVEADSIGWGNIGKIVNGSDVASSARYDTFTVANGQTHTVDFVNVRYSGIIVNKFRDSNGGSVSYDAAKSWYLTIRSGSCDGAIVASGNSTTVSAVNITAGTYYVTEADSAGWTHAGYRIDGGASTSSSASCVEVVVGSGEQHTVDFANFHPNTITVNKLRDLDGSLTTTGDQSAKAWRLELHADSAAGALVGSVSSNSTLSVSDLGDGTYYAVEADSAGWTHLGYSLNGGAAVSSASSAVALTVSDGQSSSASFINMKGNTITVRKFADAAGTFLPPGTRTAKSWYMELYRSSVSPANLVTSGNATQISASNLGDGTYIATEADSTGWIHLGAISNGSNRAGSSRFDTILVSDGQSYTTDFINAKSNSIVVRKWRDANGEDLSMDEARPWFLAVRSGSCSGTIVASGNTATLTASNLPAGTYYVTEADSAGWTHVGYKYDGGAFVYGSTTCYIVTVTANESHTMDFINFHPNTITVKKYQDTDGGETSFNTLLKWGFNVTNSLNEVIASTDTSSTLVVSGLGDGTYTVCESDSSVWTMMGYRLDGNVVDGANSCVDISVADGQVRAIDFANVMKDTAKFFSTIADSFALTFDSKGAMKSIKKKADKVEFSFTVKPDSNNVTALHLEFGVEIDTLHYDFTVIPTPASMTPDAKSKLKKWDIQFSPAIDSTTTISISGWGLKGAVQKVSGYWWLRNTTILGKKKKSPVVNNTLRLPMPNYHNLGEEIFAQGGYTGTGGLLIGVPHIEAPNSYAWVIHKKYADVQKSLVKKVKTGYLTHDSTARCFDLFKSGKFLVKKQGSLPPDKYDNKLFADLIALKLNITASALGKTPVGFGELKWVGGNVTYDGMMLKQLAALADTVLSNCATSIDPIDPVELDDIIAGVNDAFAAPFDTLNWSSKLVMKPAISVADVAFIERDPSIVPATIIPLENEIAQRPEVYQLYQNYPNPFNPTTTISFELPEASIVTLKIYNLLGQEVATLMSNVEMADGVQEITFDAKNLSSGVYFYKMSAQSMEDGSSAKFTETKKLMLVK